MALSCRMPRSYLSATATRHSGLDQAAIHRVRYNLLREAPTEATRAKTISALTRPMVVERFPGVWFDHRIASLRQPHEQRSQKRGQGHELDHSGVVRERGPRLLIAGNGIRSHDPIERGDETDSGGRRDRKIRSWV